MKLVNKPEIAKAIRKLNKNKSIKPAYFDLLALALTSAEKTLYELEEALKGNILKVKGRYSNEAYNSREYRQEFQDWLWDDEDDRPMPPALFEEM
tara:strand:- start:177 stop:461 length:285 start_codon:yes stop_codon:yes gene_type:complete